MKYNVTVKKAVYNNWTQEWSAMEEKGKEKEPIEKKQFDTSEDALKYVKEKIFGDENLIVTVSDENNSIEYDPYDKEYMDYQDDFDEIFYEYFPEDVVVESFSATEYLGNNYRGIMNELESDDIEEIIKWAWEGLNNGGYIKISDDNTIIEISPDDIDFENDLAPEDVREKILSAFSKVKNEDVNELNNQDYTIVNITSFGDDGKSFAYNLQFIKQTRNSIWAESPLYGYTYRIDIKTGELYKDGVKISNSCEYNLE